MEAGQRSGSRPVEVLAFMEAASVTGPAKNLIEFARRASMALPEMPQVRISVVTYLRGGGENAFVSAVRAAGVPIYVLPEHHRFDPQVLPAIRRIVRECDPDILQTHNIKSHFYMRLTGLHRRRPWIAFNHGYTAVDWKDRLYGNFDRWSLRAAHGVVALCGPFADLIAARGVDRKRIRVQHNSVKAFDTPSAAEAVKLKNALRLTDEEVVLSVGRLSAEKGHEDLLQAVALVSKMPDIPPFRVVIVGDGPQAVRLRGTAGRLGIADKVTMTGHQPDVRCYYAIASLLALPSHSEGSPNVVLEAMAAGVPVAATAVGGVPEILEDGQTGVLMPVGNAAGMAQVISRLLKDRGLRQKIGAAGRECALRLYTPEAYAISMARFYQEVLDTAPAALRRHQAAP